MEHLRLADEVLELLDDSPITRESVLADAKLLIDAGEVSLAFDTLCLWLFEDDLVISRPYYDRLVRTAHQLAVPSAINRLEELVSAVPQGSRPGQPRTHQYSVRKIALWGIFVQLTGEYSFRADTEAGVRLTAATTLHLARAMQVRLTEDEVHMLAHGMRRGLELAGLADPPAQIRVLDVRIVEADFQIDGLAAAGYEWIAREFRRKLPPVKVDFDTAANRYLIELPGGASCSSDD
ncbi:MafI family immunity protein [Glycomyces albidus]|uniref:MafI family immunity protein n=1 Tax=Glycomyces albidus TaxID=2656774 RepID=A0A6L5GCH9_9ACTN|nr:MafI family immunity protein [Glycomyces albidus]MQM27338.1 MafI family immunity protein [Glycomyces albidus]